MAERPGTRTIRSRPPRGNTVVRLHRIVCALALFAFAAGIFGEVAMAARRTTVTIGGVPIVLCGAAGDPASPVRGNGAASGCCEQCVLGAPATLPGTPTISAPDFSPHRIARDVRVAPAPALARWRSPRQSQGPPRA